MKEKTQPLGATDFYWLVPVGSGSGASFDSYRIPNGQSFLGNHSRDRKRTLSVAVDDHGVVQARGARRVLVVQTISGNRLSCPNPVRPNVLAVQTLKFGSAS